jgi:hypothetical protein
MSSLLPSHSHGAVLEELALAEAKILIRVAYGIPHFLLMALLSGIGHQSSQSGFSVELIDINIYIYIYNWPKY